MHPPDFANEGLSSAPPRISRIGEEGRWASDVTHRTHVFHRLRTASKLRMQLRLPRPLFLWDTNTELHCVTRTLRIQSQQRKCDNGPAHSAEKPGRFYLLAEPFCCPTNGEPLSVSEGVLNRPPT